MTTDDPRDLLSDTRALRRQVQADQRATWFPLLVLAAVTFLAIPVQGWTHYSRTCRAVANPNPFLAGRVCAIYSPASFVYWPCALVAGYVVIAAFYLRRADRRGVGTAVGVYAVVGGILALVLTAISIMGVRHPFPGNLEVLGMHLSPETSSILYRSVGPSCAIGLGLLVLSWLERNLALLATAVVFLILVLKPVTFGWTVHHPTPWNFASRLVISGGYLALAGIGFALAQRRKAG